MAISLLTIPTRRPGGTTYPADITRIAAKIDEIALSMNISPLRISAEVGLGDPAADVNEIVDKINEIIGASNGSGGTTPGAALTAALAISVASIVAGSSLTFEVTAGGGTAPYGYAVKATNNATGAVTVLGSSATGSFTPQSAGSYNIDATVTDAAGKVAQAVTRNLQVTAAQSVNRLPVASAGSDVTITAPTASLALMGTASDPDPDDTLTYLWRPIAGPNTPVGLPASTLNVVVSNLIPGTYQFGFQATDQKGGKSTEDFVVVNVNAAPSGSTGITFAPANGAPGNEVSITGTSFTGAKAVSLGGVPAFSFVVVNDTTITATVPAGAGTGPWQITKADGSTVGSAANFTFVMPAITATSLAKTTKTGKINVVCGITSLTFGAQVANQYPGDSAQGGSPYSWPGRLKTRLEAEYGVGNVTVHNRAIGGQTLQQAMAAATTDIDPYYDSSPGAQNWFLCETMANEVYSGGQGSTASAALGYLDTFIDGRRNKGFQIGLLTDTPRQLSQDYQDKMAITNAAIRGSRFAGKRHLVADVGATQLGDAGGGIDAVNNVRWYNTDKCHRTIEGYKLPADVAFYALTPWLNAVQAQTTPPPTGNTYVEDPSESAVPFQKPALYIPNAAYAKLIADNASGSRAQAIGDTPNFANTARSVQALSPIATATQWVGEVEFVVQDLGDKAVGLAGAAVTVYAEMNYSAYFNTDGVGRLLMRDKDATLESGTGSFSNVVVGTRFRFKVTQTKIHVFKDGVFLGTMARIESIDLYAASCMSKDQSITAFQLRAYKLV